MSMLSHPSLRLQVHAHETILSRTFFPSVVCTRQVFFYQSFVFCQGDGLFAAKDLDDETIIGYYWRKVLVVADMLDGGFPTHEQYTQVCRE